MKVNFLGISVAVVLLMLGGCGGSTGNTKLAKLNEGDVSSMFVKGETTSEQVRAKLGDPSDVDFDNNGHKKWTYAHTKSSLKATNYIPVVSLITGGTNDTTKKLVVIFDKNDRVLDHLVTLNKGETKVGLVH